jgi:hypothetical protein
MPRQERLDRQHQDEHAAKPEREFDLGSARPHVAKNSGDNRFIGVTDAGKGSRPMAANRTKDCMIGQSHRTRRPKAISLL